MPSAERERARRRLSWCYSTFDGTSITGNPRSSSFINLVRQRRLKKVSRIALWGAAYKLRLPQSESWVRGLVFRAYAGMPAGEVDERLRNFYDNAIAGRFRDQADGHASHQAQGRVVLVSLPRSFAYRGACARAPSVRLPGFDPHGGGRGGHYTCRPGGEPVEGDEKPRAIERFANERYGEGNWRKSYAYGDHVPTAPCSVWRSSSGRESPTGRSAVRRAAKGDVDWSDWGTLPDAARGVQGEIVAGREQFSRFCSISPSSACRA